MMRPDALHHESGHVTENKMAVHQVHKTAHEVASLVM